LYCSFYHKDVLVELFSLNTLMQEYIY